MEKIIELASRLWCNGVVYQQIRNLLEDHHSNLVQVFIFKKLSKKNLKPQKVSKRTLTRLPSKQSSLNRKANFTSRPHLPRRVTCQSILSDPDLISRVNLTRRTTFSYTPKCKVCQDTSFLYFYFCPPCIHSYLSTKTNKQLKDIYWTFICCVRA